MKLKSINRYWICTKFNKIKFFLFDFPLKTWKENQSKLYLANFHFTKKIHLLSFENEVFVYQLKTALNICFLSYRLCWKQTNSKLLSVSPKSKSMNLFFLFLFSHFNVQGLILTIEQKPNIVEKLFFYSISFISQSYLLTLEWFNLNYILNISTEKKYNEEKNTGFPLHS